MGKTLESRLPDYFILTVGKTMLKENQKIIMRIIMDWCREHTDPISQIEILMIARSSMPTPTIKATLLALTRKKYIRRAINVKPISYVKLRNLETHQYREFYEKET